MFAKLKKKKGTDIYAVAKGSIKVLNEVEDQVFSQGLVGRGLAILPSEDTIYAPVDGVLSVVFPTGHAFGITGEDGLEYLIHIGVDTVNLKGEGFTLLVKQDQRVGKGTPLVKVDFSLLKEKGYPIDTMVLVTTPSDVCELTQLVLPNAFIDVSQIIMHCEKK